jgi:hypothetical protein
MPLLGDPSVLDSLAARYERHADCVRASGRRLQLATDHTDWACDAADRFRGVAQQNTSAALSTADEMCSLAQQLRALAAELRDEIAQLIAIEARVRQLLADAQFAAGPTVATGWHAGNLPTSCDSDWRTVGRAFGV